ncbi:hypothetical protein ACMZ49_01560 [Alcaligenes phenolicus]
MKSLDNQGILIGKRRGRLWPRKGRTSSAKSLSCVADGIKKRLPISSLESIEQLAPRWGGNGLNKMHKDNDIGSKQSRIDLNQE